MAEDGGVSLAMFVMSVLLDYKYVHQSEIGEGVDYRFKKEAPSDDNFLQEGHFIEVSGILEESPTNNLKTRMKSKHQQIISGSRSDEKSSIIVTIFERPFTIKEIHI